MSFSLSASAAVMLVLCFPGGPSELPPDGQCMATANDKELAGSVSGRKTADPVLLKRIAEAEGHEQLRMAGGGVNIATDKLLSELEQQAVADAIHGAGAPDTGGNLFSPEQTIVESSVGSASINSDIRIGD